MESNAAIQEHEELSFLLTDAMGWTRVDSPSSPRAIEAYAKVGELGQHGIHEALKLVLAYPEADLREAAFIFFSKRNTDKLAFLGVEQWTHHSLMKTVRSLGGARRYQHDDFLQAETSVLTEARTLVAITNLCLSGELSNGFDNIDEIEAENSLRYTLKNDGLVELVQKYPNKGDDIIGIMRTRNTCDPSLIRNVLYTTTPLIDGIL